MLPLGFVIFPYFIRLVFKISVKQSLTNLFFCGFFFGLGFLFIFLSWIYNPFLVYKATKPFAILAILLPILLAIFIGLSFIIFRYIKNYFFLIILTPFIFILTEFFISSIFYGFPWLTYSLILSNNSLGFYIIKYFGTLGSGFLLISVFLIPSLFVNIYKIKRINKIVFFLYLPFLLVLIFPYNYIFSSDQKFSKELKLDIYQILSPINKINREEVEKNIYNLAEQTNSDLIIFAENNYPYNISDIMKIELNKLIKNDKKIIIGATREENGRFYNSFLFLEEDNNQYFDKKILVPFGEFLPFRKYLKFMETISGTIDFETGNIGRIIKTKDDIKILPIICYEIIFDQIFKNVNIDQIDILINITNDSWFGNKIGPYQHLYLTRIKSLIANKPIVRVSNNGITAVIDNNAKLIKLLKINQKGNLNYNLKIKNTTSFYMIHNYLFYYIIFLFIFYFILSRKNNK